MTARRLLHSLRLLACTPPELAQVVEYLPPVLVTSSRGGRGKGEVLAYIGAGGLKGGLPARVLAGSCIICCHVLGSQIMHRST